MLGYVRELLARQNIEDFHPETYSHVAYRSTRERPWTNRNPATRPMVTSTGPINSFFATGQVTQPHQLSLQPLMHMYI